MNGGLVARGLGGIVSLEPAGALVSRLPIGRGVASIRNRACIASGTLNGVTVRRRREAKGRDQRARRYLLRAGHPFTERRPGRALPLPVKGAGWVLDGCRTRFGRCFGYRSRGTRALSG